MKKCLFLFLAVLTFSTCSKDPITPTEIAIDEATTEPLTFAKALEQLQNKGIELDQQEKEELQYAIENGIQWTSKPFEKNTADVRACGCSPGLTKNVIRNISAPNPSVYLQTYCSEYSPSGYSINVQCVCYDNFKTRVYINFASHPGIMVSITTQSNVFIEYMPPGCNNYTYVTTEIAGGMGSNYCY